MFHKIDDPFLIGAFVSFPATVSHWFLVSATITDHLWVFGFPAYSACGSELESSSCQQASKPEEEVENDNGICGFHVGTFCDSSDRKGNLAGSKFCQTRTR